VVSDQIATFDISNRDTPVRKSALTVMNIADKSVRVGAHLAELGGDPLTGDPRITVVPIAGGTNAVPVGTVELASAIGGTTDPCKPRYGGFSEYAQMFVNGNLVYVVYDATLFEQNGTMGFIVVDLADPTSPKVMGSSVFRLTAPVDPYSNDSYAYGVGFWRNYSDVFGGAWPPGGEPVVRAGSTVVIQEIVAAGPGRGQAVLHSVDLSDPSNVRLASSVAIADGGPSSGLFSDGSVVLTAHHEDLASNPARTHFFVDRVDFSNPAAPVRTKINVPGSLFGVDRGANRIVTIDYSHATTPDMFIRLVDLGQNGATLLDTFHPQVGPMIWFGMGADRFWIAHFDGSPYSLTSVDTLTGIRAGAFQMASTFAASGDSLLAQTDGTAVGVLSDYPKPRGIKVYDTADAANPRVAVDVPLPTPVTSRDYYYRPDLAFDDDYAILSIGAYGAHAFATK
jgi:hypothetical protein